MKAKHKITILLNKFFLVTYHLHPTYIYVYPPREVPIPATASRPTQHTFSLIWRSIVCLMLRSNKLYNQLAPPWNFTLMPKTLDAHPVVCMVACPVLSIPIRERFNGITKHMLVNFERGFRTKHDKYRFKRHLHRHNFIFKLFNKISDFSYHVLWCWIIKIWQYHVQVSIYALMVKHRSELFSKIKIDFIASWNPSHISYLFLN